MSKLVKVGEIHNDMVKADPLYKRGLSDGKAYSDDLIAEQRGTIGALNIALGGERSTSTENLVDAHDLDLGDVGLIALCRKLIADSSRLADMEKARTEPVAIADGTFNHACEPGTALYAAPPDAQAIIASKQGAIDILNSMNDELQSEVERLTAELAAANERIAELEQDAARLDWMIKHSDASLCSDGAYGPFHVWLRYSNRTTDPAKTAREAIDAARKEAQP